MNVRNIGKLTSIREGSVRSDEIRMANEEGIPKPES
jgi:hypothetical protein